MITQARLKELLSYDRQTGLFTRRVPNKVRPKGFVYGAAENKYVQISIDGRTYPAHRLAWLYVHGKFPVRPFEIDHIDRRKNNNAFDNLRVVTRSQNRRNAMPVRRHRKRDWAVEKYGLRNSP